MEDYANECYDSIAIFLSIHIVHRYRSIMEKRNVPALERYTVFFFDLLQLHLMTLPWIECYYVLVSIETKLQKNKRLLMARKYFGYAYCC